MFCPACGNPDQTAATYCRRCGSFLPDIDKPRKKSQTPIQNVTANAIFSAMTIVAASTLAILLYSMLGFREDTHPLIYITAGFLIAITAWNIQTLYRSIQLRKHFKRSPAEGEIAAETPVFAPPVEKSLSEADFSDIVPPSVVDATTRKLEKTPRSSKTEE